MILVTYIKPHIMIYADKLISGKLFINDSNGDLLWNMTFNNKDFINIDVLPKWKKSITVNIQTGKEDVKKQFSI